MYSNLVYGFSLMLFLSACNFSAQPSPMLTVTATATETATLTPTATITPSQTFTLTPSAPPAATPAVGVTPTVALEGLHYQCLKISDSLPPGKSLQGVLVFKNQDNTDAFLWNMQAGTQTRFPREEGDRLLDFQVSADGQRLLYLHVDKTQERYIITRSDGRSIWSKVVNTFYSWFDNERLFTLAHPADGFPYLILLNPATDEQLEIQPDYPNIDKMFSPDVKWRGSAGIPVYDPTLTRVVYAECDAKCKEDMVLGNPDWPVVLWNIETKQTIARLMTMDFYGKTPVWSQDGKQFVMAADILPGVFDREPFYLADEFFVVSRDGRIRQLTHFMDSLKSVDIYDSYTFSPNGQWVAFWMVAQPGPYTDAQLAVMNVEMGAVTNYCIKGDPYTDAVTPDSLAEPIWSPDSTQLLVISRDPQNTDRKRIVVVDVTSAYAATITENVMPAGWMVAPGP